MAKVARITQKNTDSFNKDQRNRKLRTLWKLQHLQYLILFKNIEFREGETTASTQDNLLKRKDFHGGSVVKFLIWHILPIKVIVKI